MPTEALVNIKGIVVQFQEQIKEDEKNAKELEKLWGTALSLLADPFAQQVVVDSACGNFIAFASMCGFGSDFVADYETVIKEKNELRLKTMDAILKALFETTTPTTKDDSNLNSKVTPVVEQFAKGFVDINSQV